MMMMMEERKKFVCKYCSKRFPCGKSLGGHIRTHITEERTAINASSNSPIAAAAATHDLLLKKKRKRDSPWPTHQSGPAANNNYGLRENPKKTTRFVHIDAAAAAATNLARDKEERFCKECGKGFPSMKALCGHMACHSDKDKDREKFVVMAMDDDDDDDGYSQSDAESSGAASLLPRRRSKRMMRFKNLRPFCSSSPSASVSEVEQQQEEQEEVARMLMMLSRDSGCRKGRLPSLTESSDNNSVVLDTNKVAAVAVSNNGSRKNFVPNDSDSAVGSLRSTGLKNKMVDSSDVSMDEFKGWNKNVKDKDKERRSKYSSSVAFAATVKDLEYETTVTTTTTTRKKFDFRKRANYDSLIHTSTEVPIKSNGKAGFSNDEYDDCSYDSTEYDDVDEDEESDENSTDTDSFPAPKAHSTKASTKGNKSKKNMKNKKKKKKKNKLKLKKSKEHECPICYKIFKSGQALGGHKRSHFIGGSSEENTLVIKQHHAPPSSLVVPNCLIDLNLPAPVDD
ncbi:hypothetical protein PIB30_021950 [Stylosanthes scabra]|uniref:C2H2-type domain-containing protein n=1 Tax=Stylosanthes scabra TaxID=79078 RepID=A0ABU6U8A7_9FABA|nr:hypothetical protein [Stylosanthes scabra]